MPTTAEIIEQSKCAYNQWAEQWRKQADYVSKFDMKSLDDFENIGVGKACLVIANGYSFEENIQTIKDNQDHCDIFCIDKTLKHCIDNGITPQYCLVCDANVNYEKYMEPVKDKLQDTVLFINVCANPKWIDNGNWKDYRFFVNRDVLESEKEFSALSGCNNLVPAGTNVSNAAVVFLNQSDNDGIKNYFGYDILLLIGYDYCWNKKGYYAFDHMGDGKYHYMRNVHLYNSLAEFCYSSTNLLFSARWLNDYIKIYKVKAVQCSNNTILETVLKSKDLAKSMHYNFKPEHSEFVRYMLKSKREMLKSIKEINQQITEIGKQHYFNLIREV